jgi:hypothetical protein
MLVLTYSYRIYPDLARELQMLNSPREAIFAVFSCSNQSHEGIDYPSIGRVMVNTVPRPKVESQQIVPPCCSVII